MITKKRMRARDAARYRRSQEVATKLPRAATEAFIDLARQLDGIADILKLSPEQMLSGLAWIGAGVLLIDLDMRDEAEINRRLAFAQAALQLSVATLRPVFGAVGERPGGSFGVGGHDA